MAAEALITGLLALLAFAVVVGILVEVMVNVSEKGLHFLFKRDSERSENRGKTEGFEEVGKHFSSRSAKRIEHVCEKRTFRDKGRNALLVGAIVFCLTLLPNTAFATDFGYVFYGPVTFTYEGATTYEVGIVAENQYDAAAYMLGYDPNSEEFTPEVKALLSNSDTGTAFYGFAQNFVHPREAGSVFSPEFWSTANAVYGHEYVWRGTYTQTGKLAAQIALEAVLNGGGSGGGSGGGESGGAQFELPATFTFDTMYQGRGVNSNYTNFDNVKYYYSTNYDLKSGEQLYPSKFTLQVDKTSVDSDLQAVLNAYENGDDLIIACTPKGSGGRFSSFMVYFHVYEHGTWQEMETTVGTDTYVTGFEGTYVIGAYRILSISNNTAINAFTTDTSSWSKETSGRNGAYYAGVLIFDHSSDAPVLPPTNWPDDGDVHIWKEPPVPWPDTPDDPVITDDPIYLPDPTMPIPSPEDGPTYTTADLSAVLDAMNRHCIHLQNAIYGAASQFWSLLSSKMTNDLSAFTTWLGSWFGTFITTFQAGLSGLETYLHDLAAWLAEQLDYTFTSSAYDDGSVVAWLKKIWAKLGTGPIVTRPDDPVSDPSGWGDWLKRLLDNFIATLMGLGAEVLGGIGDDLAALTGKFPFCIPWDVGAVLALFAADPVTPVVEYPLYTVTMDGLTSTPCVIDCSPYDPYMVVVRGVELAIFCAGLAWKTKDVLEGFALAGGD